MNKNTLYWLCQIGGWLLFVMLEFIGYGSQYSFTALLVLNVAINYAAGILLTHYYRVFIIKMQWISRPMPQLIPRAILGVVTISTLLTIINIYLDRLTVPLLRQLPIDWVLIINYLFNWSKYILLWALVYHLFQYWERSLEIEKERYQLEAILKENQYQNLKTQLNPHFLFNSLNSIRTLIDLNPSQSKEAVTRLSSLLRSSLQMSKLKTVSLKQEIETVKDYLAIEKIRFDERLTCTIHIPDERALLVQIPPMMLQTLVENAVKHGISKSKLSGTISLDALIDGNFLSLVIINTGRFEPNETHQGLGLENTRKRLEFVYDNKALFSIANRDENTVITKIEIPL